MLEAVLKNVTFRDSAPGRVETMLVKMWSHRSMAVESPING
jgi:hypothetical protein